MHNTESTAASAIVLLPQVYSDSSWCFNSSLIRSASTFTPYQSRCYRVTCISSMEYIVGFDGFNNVTCNASARPRTVTLLSGVSGSGQLICNDPSVVCANAGFGPSSSLTLAGVTLAWERSRDNTTVKITASAAGTVWIAVGLGSAMVGGRVVVGRLDGATALVTEHIMSGYTASGVGAPVPSSIGSGATLETRNGRTTLSFTASAIAAQPLNVMGADSIIVARGSSNVWAYHAERGTAVVDWTSRASPAPSVSRAPSASPTISPTAGAIAFFFFAG